MLFWASVEAVVYQFGLSYYGLWGEIPEALQLIALGCALLLVSELALKAMHWEASRKTNMKTQSPVLPSVSSASSFHSGKHAGT